VQRLDQIVGRAAELDTMQQALAALERGRPGVLEVVGDPGIGKTRLLHELATLADARGWLVLSGSASELEDDLPFWVFVDALDDYVRGLDPRRSAAVGDDVLSELAHVLPSLPGEPDAGLQIERYRSHRAVRRLLETLATFAPLVLVLDDVHWADPGSIELLGALLRRPLAGPVLLALAARPHQVPERVAGALERARRIGMITRIPLGALDADAARELLGDAPNADALYEESGGNPFFLQELARAAAHRGSGSDVPRAVVAALGEELVQLEEDALRVLRGAAVAGDPFEVELAAAAAGVPDTTAVEALDDLLRRDFVRPTDVPRRFRFRHPLVRNAIYEGMPGGWRLAAHERSAAALEARGAGAALRAHHVEQAAHHGDLAAIAVLREAGEAIAHQTPAGAARWLAAALRLLPDTAPAQERVELLSALAATQAATGRFGDAHGSLVEAIAITPSSSAGRLSSACAALEQILGRPDDARARLERALAAAPPPENAALMIDLGVEAFYGMDWASSRRWGDRALAVVRPLGDAPLTAAAAAAVASSLAYAGESAEAAGYRDEAAALVDAMTDAELAVRLDAAAQLAGAEVYLGRVGEGLAHARRGLAVARSSGQGDLFPVLIPAVIGALFMLGRLTEAAELIDGAIEGARLEGNAQPLAWYLLSSASVQMLRGDLDAALGESEESVAIGRDLGVNVVSSYADMIYGHVLIEAGEPQRGAELLVRAGGGPSLPQSPGAWRAWDLERLVVAWLALDRNEDASRAADEAEAVAAGIGREFADAAARRARARVTLATGDATEAAEQALGSAAAAEEAGAVVEAALSRLLAGRAFGQAGETDRAVAELEMAAERLEGAGAARYFAETERELRRLGQARHRRTRAGRPGGSGVETLTERELEVARLVVDRKTNPEIAAELFLSQKTVETHLRNLFHKLGVSSRVEVARVVEEADRIARRSSG
jgi:DNA-binding NarL/FixJ family response regulator